MNGWFILILVVIAAAGAWGFHKGFLLSAYSLAAWIIAILVVSCAAPILAESVINGTDIDEKIQEYTVRQLKAYTGQKEEELKKEIEKDTDITDGADKEATKKAKKKASKKTLETVGVRIPDSLGKNLLDAEKIKKNGIGDLGIYDLIAARIARMIISGASFVIVLIVLRIATAIVAHSIKIASRVPVIHQVDKIAGLALGVLEGLLVVWIILAVIAFCSATEWGKHIADQVYENPLLRILYESNPITGITGQFL